MKVSRHLLCLLFDRGPLQGIFLYRRQSRGILFCGGILFFGRHLRDLPQKAFTFVLKTFTGFFLLQNTFESVQKQFQ